MSPHHLETPAGLCRSIHTAGSFLHFVKLQPKTLMCWILSNRQTESGALLL